MNGSCLIGYYTASYRELYALFGESSECDKSSTQWIVNYKGKNYSIYDYKETELYDEDLPSVEEFRSQESYNWHIGGWGERIDENDEFIKYLNKELKR